MFGLFRGKDTPAKISDRCFAIFREAIASINAAVASETIKDLNKTVLLEASIAMYAAVRGAINGARPDIATIMQQSCQLFDEKVANALPLGRCGIDVDSRMQFYFQLLCEHFEEIQQDSPKAFNLSLGHHFTQFCSGKGAASDPVVIGDFFQSAPIQAWIVQMWWQTFPSVMAYLKTVKT